MELTAAEFLEKTGLKEPLAPGQIKLVKRVGKNPATSFTLVYDWKTDPNKIRVEMRPGLSGEKPSKKDLAKYALWLQSENFAEFEFHTDSKKKTKH